MDLPENYIKAVEIKETDKQVKLPPLDGWNAELPIRPFQKKGVAWLYLARRALLADPVGLGKTIQALGLISLLKTTGRPYRTIVIAPNYNSEMQWYRETRRFTSLIACPVNGEKAERVGQGQKGKG